VAPITALFNFSRGKLRVMDQDVRVLAELDIILRGPPLPPILPEFVIRHENENPAAFFEPECKSVLRMMEGCSTDCRALYLKVPVAQFIQISDFSFEVREFDREKPIPHFVIKGVLETVHAGRIAVDLQVSRRLVKGTEVRKAENVIPVDMGDEKMNIESFTLGRQLVAQRPDPCPGINDNDVSALKGDLKACGVSAVKDGVFSRNRNRAAGAPKLDSHKPFPGTT
jgi:hypothetical protein